MPVQMSFTDAVIEIFIQLAPTFVLVCLLFIICSWLRVIVDYMSGRNF